MKAIIIGGGIAGLTCAHACIAAGIDVKIYEKTKVLRNIGGGILLWPHGLTYLDWLSLSDVVEPFNIPIEGCEVFGHTGEKVFGEAYTEFYDLVGGTILPIDRSVLQQGLFAKLPQDTVVLEKTCARIETDAHQARVIFSDGSYDEADIVIGADGIHSTLRNSLTSMIPDYTNHCWWGGIVSRKDVPFFNPHHVYMAMDVNKLCIVWPTYGDKLMWYLPVKMSLNHFDSSSSGFDQIKSICKGWLPEIEELLKAKPSAQSFHLPIYALSPQIPRVQERLVLIGDASHALGPILGQGASQAIEDAYVLINCLKQQADDIDGALRRYAHMRLPKYERLSQLEETACAAMINDNLETLIAFEQQLSQVTIAMMYQELIPLVDKKACLQLADSFKTEIAA